MENTFDTGIVTLNYAELPSPGNPVVLLHGGNARWQSLESILPDLASTWHVYAPLSRQTWQTHLLETRDHIA